MSGFDTPQGISNNYISMMLKSIKVCMVQVQDAVSVMEEMLEYLSVNISKEEMK